MKVIITGGTGLIGRALTAELVRTGHQVIILSRNPQPVSGMPAMVSLERWDGRTAEGWGHLVEEADGIVNLAGESVAGESLFSLRWTEKRKNGILDSRKNAGDAIVAAVTAARHKPAVVLQVSAVGFYGPQDAQPIYEDAPAGTDFLANVCVAWEQSTAQVASFGVRHVIARVGVVLDAHGGALPRQMLPFKFFVGGPIGRGDQAYPWIHIQDVAEAMVFLLENQQAQGAYNLTAPNCVSNADFGRALGKVIHRPAWIPVPAFVFKLAFGEASIVLLEGQAPSPHKIESLGYHFRFPQVLPALQAIFGH